MGDGGVKDERPRCSALTRKGKQCRRNARKSGLCATHEVVRRKAEAPDEGPLTDQERAFVAHYVANGFSGIRAALSVNPDQLRASARVRASRLLSRTNIKAAIDDHLGTLDMNAGEVLARLSQMARGSLEPFLVHDANGMPFLSIGGDEAIENLHLLKKIKLKRHDITDRDGNVVAEEVTTEFELHDSKDALKTLARIKGLGGEDARVEVHNHYGSDELDNDELRRRMIERGLLKGEQS